MFGDDCGLHGALFIGHQQGMVAVFVEDIGAEHWAVAAAGEQFQGYGVFWFGSVLGKL